MRGLVIVLLAVGCTTVAPPKVAPSPPKPPESLPPACTEPRLVVAPRIEVNCWPQTPCKGTFEYAIDNCTDKTVSLRVLIVNSKGAKHEGTEIVELDPSISIPPRTQRTFTYPAPGSNLSLPLGETVLHAKVDERILDATFTLVDPGLEKARADCIAHGDDWGMHGGFVSTLGCQPVMKDAGKDCSDERDCEGYCFLESEEPISKTEKRVHGKCSRFRLRFGCHVAIGKTNGGVMPINKHFARLCVD